MVMRPNARVGATVAVAALVVLAGCGSSSGSTSGGSPDTSSTTTGGSGTGGSGSDKKKIDVCKIVTPADAEKVVGGPVETQAAAESEGLSSGVCIYKATGGGIRVSLLQVRVYPGPQFYGEDALPKTKSIDIAGADKAFVRSSAGGKTIDVQFVKDGQTGAINFTDTGATASDAAVTNVQTVAEKLAAAI
jgi:hypothetical protein